MAAPQAPVCPECAKIFLEPRERHEHFETLAQLLESTKTCLMCTLLLNSIPDGVFSQIMEQIGAGSYSRLAVLGAANLSDTKVPWIGKSLEINTRKNYLWGKTFAILTQRGE
jgi:hypothetical protein